VLACGRLLTIMHGESKTYKINILVRFSITASNIYVKMKIKVIALLSSCMFRPDTRPRPSADHHPYTSGRYHLIKHLKEEDSNSN